MIEAIESMEHNAMTKVIGVEGGGNPGELWPDGRKWAQLLPAQPSSNANPNVPGPPPALPRAAGKQPTQRA